jgi:predicted nucleic acid-binding protein
MWWPRPWKPIYSASTSPSVTGYSIHDSMIVAAALQAGCRTLYTEDMQHGQSINRLLTIINPYR